MHLDALLSNKFAPPGACSGGGRDAASSRIATHSFKVGL